MFNRLSPVVKNLIIINFLVWISTFVMPRLGIDILDFVGLHYFQADKFNVGQLFSYMFVHEDFSHLFFNMFSLFMLGSLLESTMGQKRFLTYYIITGIGAALVQEVVWYFSIQEILEKVEANIGSVSSLDVALQISVQKAAFLNRFVTIGASGAVFGILLAFGMIFPNLQLFIFPIPIPIKAKFFVVGYGLIEIFAGIRSVSGAGDGIAHFAHLGGMIFGIILLLWWRKKDNFGRPLI